MISAAGGRVLEVGIGSGLNLPFYRATVHSVIGLDPSPELLGMAHARVATASVPIELLEGSAETIPLEAGSIDTAAITWTLCTIPDARRALAELRRVLKPGGVLLFVEHGRAPEPSVARWQDWLDPLWRRISGGCHLNRKIDDLISSNGFRINALANARDCRDCAPIPSCTKAARGLRDVMAARSLPTAFEGQANRVDLLRRSVQAV